MDYDSPTLTFVGGIFDQFGEFIATADSDLGKGFCLLCVLCLLGAVGYGLYWITFNFFVWTVPLIIALFAVLDLLAFIGSFLR